VTCILGVLALTAAGCGAQNHTNDPRPSPPTRVSVTITRDTVTVQPNRIGLGPDRTQQIPQNQEHPQPSIRSNGPLTVAFVTANFTRFDSHLEVHGPRNATSEPLVANGAVTLQADLPTGIYRISAADIPGAKPAKLAVGPYRASSQNDVLLP
jgi:hypothetical protein